MFRNPEEQYLSPNDDGYDLSGMDPETGNVEGMSWDTTRAFREMLDREREDNWAIGLWEAFGNA